MNTFIHIGLHKTSSTTLQYLVFPEISKFLKKSYHNFESLNLLELTKSLIKNKKKIDDYKFIPNLENSIISWEGLSSWDMNPFFYNTLFEFNKRIFKKNSTIFLVLREPESLLTSIYIEKIMEFILLKPNEFFISDKEFLRLSKLKKFGKSQGNLVDIELRNKLAPQLIEYEKLISNYVNHFDQVIICKYENIKKLEFLDYLTKDTQIKQKLKNSFNKHLGNRSFSKQSIILSLILRNFLKIFFLDYRDLKKFKHMLYFKCPKNLYQKKWNKFFLKYTNWAHLIRYYIDRKIKYKKFKINYDDLGIDLNKQKKAYQKLPDFKVYKK
jgi:hypothetical protein